MDEKELRRKQKLAHEMLVAIGELDIEARKFYDGPYKEFDKIAKRYLKEFPNVDRTTWHEANQGVHAMTSALSNMMTDQLGGGKHRLIPRDMFEGYKGTIRRESLLRPRSR